MQREVIEVPVISEAIRKLGAPTSALVRAGDLLFTCGMPPIDIRTGEIVAGDIGTQTHACLDALDMALRHAGSSLDKVVKATVFVTDPALMGAVNAVYRERFGEGFPARTSAAIKPWPLPFDIEIECVATRG